MPDSLTDPDPQVRIAAVEAVGQRASHEKTPDYSADLPILHEMLRTDPDRDVRRSTAYALGAIGKAESVPVLVEAYTTADQGLRLVIVKSLGKIGVLVPLLDELAAFGSTLCLRTAAQRAVDRIEAAQPEPPALPDLYD
ncbi:MAG: HEAT repeat domain-containing protein [Chloroflexi bacterium]|nr:HEAT repeat domain-containing protein [Chloroflexota bacterium]